MTLSSPAWRGSQHIWKNLGSCDVQTLRYVAINASSLSTRLSARDHFKRPTRRPRAHEDARLHRDRRAHARARHRCQHGHLQPRQRRPLPRAAGTRSRRAGAVSQRRRTRWPSVAGRGEQWIGRSCHRAPREHLVLAADLRALPVLRSGAVARLRVRAVQSDDTAHRRSARDDRYGPARLR